MSKIFDKVSFWSLFVTIVSLPVFFLPFTKFPIDISKNLILVLGLSFSIIFWAIARFFDGKIILPKSWILWSGGIIIFATLLSSIFSSDFIFSMFGTMLDIGSFYFLLAAFLLMLFSTIIFNDEKKINLIFKGVMISSVITLFFQLARFFMPNILSFGVLFDNTNNLIGSFNSFGFYAGLIILFSIISFSFVPVSKITKFILGLAVLISVFFVILTNFSFIWIILGIFSLFIFVYKLSFYSKMSVSNVEENKIKKSRFPAIPFLMIIISIFFLLGGRNIGNFLPSYLGISNVDIRPSVTATFNVAQDVIIKNPIFGMGPNSFSNAWDLYKPNVVNNTDFWSTSFEFGSGILPTYMLTTGIVGILAWTLFLIIILIFSFKILFLKRKKGFVNSKTPLFLLLALYLFVSSFFYAVSPVLLLLAFAFLGIALSASGSIKETNLQFLNNSRKGFPVIIILIIIILASISAGFKYTERFISISYFQKTISAQSLELAEKNINKAVALYSNDLYLRTYSQVYLLKFKSISSKEEQALTEIEKAELKNSFEQAVKGSELAINFNKNSYLNFKSLGMVYEFFATYGVQNADQSAIEMYKKASDLNPQNPSLKLDIARAYLATNNDTEAKNYALQAFDLKKDYIDAMFMISQILKKEGNNKEALRYAQLALSYDSTNSQLIQYADSLINQNNLSGSESNSVKVENKKLE